MISGPSFTSLRLSGFLSLSLTITGVFSDTLHTSTILHRHLRLDSLHRFISIPIVSITILSLEICSDSEFLGGLFVGNILIKFRKQIVERGFGMLAGFMLQLAVVLAD